MSRILQDFKNKIFFQKTKIFPPKIFKRKIYPSKIHQKLNTKIRKLQRFPQKTIK